MLAPEVDSFQLPKIITGLEKHETINFLIKKIKDNSFYENIVITIPDEIRVNSAIQESVLEDNEYYKIHKCSILEFFEPNFIEYFVKKGKLYCLTSDRNCIVENCVAITPDGILSLHLLKFVYETVGIQGRKQKYGFYEVNIDLRNFRKDIKERIKQSPLGEEIFNLNLIWEPDSDDVCPSSVAKYFSDRGVNVSLCSIEIKFLNPNISRVPNLEEVDSIVEWIGMLAHNVDMEQKHNYISSYEEPMTEQCLETNNISLLIIKGFFTPTLIIKLCQSIHEYVSTRDIENYWAGLSYQICDSSPWRRNMSTPRMFLAFDCCNSIFFTRNGIIRHTIGQLKYT